jgi:predicted DCC family thiol-disulfide oxidoreductase YuxK
MRPHPAEDLPDRLLVFDGVCVFCAHWVRFVLARDRAQRWRFAAIQEPFGRAVAARYGIDADAATTNVVVRDGVAHFRSDAALAVLSDMPGWGFSRHLRLVPRALRDAVYDVVAKHRYRWFGRTETCLVPTPEVRARFITTLPASHAAPAPSPPSA